MCASTMSAAPEAPEAPAARLPGGAAEINWSLAGGILEHGELPHVGYRRIRAGHDGQLK
jgi:hypothetical protein